MQVKSTLTSTSEKSFFWLSASILCFLLCELGFLWNFVASLHANPPQHVYTRFISIQMQILRNELQREITLVSEVKSAFNTPLMVSFIQEINWSKAVKCSEDFAFCGDTSSCHQQKAVPCMYCASWFYLYVTAFLSSLDSSLQSRVQNFN